MILVSLYDPPVVTIQGNCPQPTPSPTPIPKWEPPDPWQRLDNDFKSMEAKMKIIGRNEDSLCFCEDCKRAQPERRELEARWIRKLQQKLKTHLSEKE